MKITKLNFDRLIRFTILIAVAIALAASVVVRAHANGCDHGSYGHSKPATLKPSTPTSSIGVGSTSTSSASAGQSQGQGQSASQGQGQTSSNSNTNGQSASGGTGGSATGGTGGNGSASSTGGTGGAGNAKASTGAIDASSGASTANSASGPSSAISGASSSAGGSSAVNQSSTATDSGNFTYREAANVVQPATMIIQGCQVQGQAGGSNTRGAAMLGIGFTPKNCYDYIQAQAYLAIGAIQAACEILNHTAAAQRAIKSGAKLPDCLLPVVAVIATPTPETYTRDQVAAIVRKAVTK